MAFNVQTQSSSTRNLEMVVNIIPILQLQEKLNPSGKSEAMCPSLWDVKILLPFSATCSYSQPLLFLRKVIFKREVKSESSAIQLVFCYCDKTPHSESTWGGKGLLLRLYSPSSEVRTGTQTETWKQ